MSTTRKVLKDFVFHDGTRVSKGDFISVPSTPVHFDNGLYSHAERFDGFRFWKLGSQPGEGPKQQVVTTSAEYNVFGHGRGAWYAYVATRVPM